eukprot:3930836-Rhodomonas_salina.4
MIALAPGAAAVPGPVTGIANLTRARAAVPWPRLTAFNLEGTQVQVGDRVRVGDRDESDESRPYQQLERAAALRLEQREIMRLITVL